MTENTNTPALEAVTAHGLTHPVTGEALPLEDDPPAPQAGDTLELVTGQRLLVQYTEDTPDGLQVYGRWIGQDGTIDTLAAHILEAGDTIE